MDFSIAPRKQGYDIKIDAETKHCNHRGDQHPLPPNKTSNWRCHRARIPTVGMLSETV